MYFIIIPNTSLGPKSCRNVSEEGGGPQYCFESGIGYNYGSYLDYGYTDDEILCQQRCQAYAGTYT